MAINRIENVSIDNDNKAFGGFIYSISYNIALGGETTTLKVRLISETGEYFFTEDDLKTRGAPTEIRIGNNIVFYGYPITARFEKSSAGKILEIDYVDESIAYLDQRRVELKGRIGGIPKTTIETDSAGNTVRVYQTVEVPSNIILLGRPFINKTALGENLRIELTADAFNDPLNLNYDGDLNLLTIEDKLSVPDIEYNFPDLIAALTDIIDEAPVLTSDHNKFYRSYTGTVREVLASWCSDLGLTFFWQNRKLNFIDLRNPDTFDVIKSSVNDIISQVKPESTDETITLRGTAVRAQTSLYLRNGRASPETQKNQVQSYQFLRLTLDSIVGLKNYYGVSGSFLSEPWVSLIKAGKFSKELIALNLCKKATTSSYTYFPNQTDATKASFAVRRLDRNATSDSTAYNFLKTAANEYYHSSNQYLFFQIFRNDKIDSNLTKNLDDSFVKWQRISEYLGRFHYYKIGKNEFVKAQFTSDVRWFHEDSPLTDTPIGKLLEKLSDAITNFSTITLKGFIEGNSSITIDSLDDFFTPKSDYSGYAIMEREPIWTPNSLEEIYSSKRIFLYEPKSDSDSLTPTTFYIGLNLGAPLGIISSQSEAEALNAIDIAGIKAPKETDITIYSVPKDEQFTFIEPKLEFVKTSYVDDYETAQVERIDMNTSNVPEELIIAQGPVAGGLSNITEANFNAAHDQYVTPLLFSQTKPFFTKTFTLSYIDLPVEPEIQNGFQSLDISYGNDGLTATYTFSTEQMRLPTPGYYLASFYDAKQKQLTPYLKPWIISLGGSAPRTI